MTAPDDLARTLAAEVDGIALIIASTSGSAGAPALTAAEAIVAHLASVVSRRDADLRTRIEALHFEVEGGWCDHCWTGPDAHGNGPSPEWPCATIRALDTDTGRGQ